MAIKLVALDLDDTLLNKALRISERAQEAIRQAVLQGVTVTISTGRMYASALPYAQQLGMNVPLITYNGALIKDCAGEIFFHQGLAEPVAWQILALFKERGWYIQSYIGDVLYVKELDDMAKYYEKHASVKAVPMGNKLYTLPGEPTKMLALAKEHEVREIAGIIDRDFAGKASAVASKPTFLELIHPNVNKGLALKFLAHKFGIHQEEVMAVGDSNNDLDMIRYAGLGVAMGNATENVKAVAQVVTSTNEEDGVAEAIEKYVLR